MILSNHINIYSLIFQDGLTLLHIAAWTGNLNLFRAFCNDVKVQLFDFTLINYSYSYMDLLTFLMALSIQFEFNK